MSAQIMHYDDIFPENYAVATFSILGRHKRGDGVSENIMLFNASL